MARIVRRQWLNSRFSREVNSAAVTVIQREITRIDLSVAKRWSLAVRVIQPKIAWQDLIAAASCRSWCRSIRRAAGISEGLKPWRIRGRAFGLWRSASLPVCVLQAVTILAMALRTPAGVCASHSWLMRSLSELARFAASWRWHADLSSADSVVGPVSSAPVDPSEAG